MYIKSTVLIAAFALILGLATVAHSKDDPLAFCYAAPADLSKHRKLELWGTYYHTKVAQDSKTGFPLLDVHDKPIGPKLAREDWCKAALEGAVAVSMPDGSKVIVNVRDAGRSVPGRLRQLFSAPQSPCQVRHAPHQVFQGDLAKCQIRRRD